VYLTQKIRATSQPKFLFSRPLFTGKFFPNLKKLLNPAYKIAFHKIRVPNFFQKKNSFTWLQIFLFQKTIKKKLKIIFFSSRNAAI